MSWRCDFLDLSDAEKVRSGADVVWRLLEQDGLKPEKSTSICRHWRTGTDAPIRRQTMDFGPSCSGPWRGCVQSEAGAGSRPPSCTGPCSARRLGDDLEAIRLAGLEGLANIDKAAAVAKARVSLVNDASATIRVRLVDLAGEVGGRRTLTGCQRGSVQKEKVRRRGRPCSRSCVVRQRRWWPGWAMDPQADPGIYTPARRAALLALLEQKAQAEEQGGPAPRGQDEALRALRGRWRFGEGDRMWEPALGGDQER